MLNQLKRAGPIKALIVASFILKPFQHATDVDRLEADKLICGGGISFGIIPDCNSQFLRESGDGLARRFRAGLPRFQEGRDVGNGSRRKIGSRQRADLFGKHPLSPSVGISKLASYLV